jgi:ribosomal-protein-alanine N-acetyltransferase
MASFRSWRQRGSDKGEEVVKPQRVSLRLPTADDGEAFLTAVRASVTLHHPWIFPPDSPTAFAAYLQRLAKEEYEGRLICRQPTGELVGVINLNNIIRGAFQNAFLGYYAFAPFAGRGLMQEGLELLLTYAFRDLQLHRVEANIQPGNLASLALVQRCGFSKEGFSRRYLQVGSEWCDHERWALLAEDWKATQTASF